MGANRGDTELYHSASWVKISAENILKYRIRPNYRTYPYKRTVKQFRSLQITASAILSTYIVCTHLNCIDLSMQFKWVPTIYAFIKKIRRKKTDKHHQIGSLLIFFFFFFFFDVLPW